MESRHVSRVIAAPAASVYAFASDPDTLSLWAGGLARSSVARRGDELLVDSPMGQVTVRFAPPNTFGVLDHDVTLPSGATVTNPVRVCRHPEGAEIVFSVRQLDLTDEQFEQDVAAVGRDLDTLKRLIEAAAR